MAKGEPFALRLDAETRSRIARLARWKGSTVSDVIREAVGTMLDREERLERPADLAGDLVGCVEGGDPSRSSGGGRRVAEVLRARRSRR
jgi:predicted DNA-binding protein